MNRFQTNTALLAALLACACAGERAVLYRYADARQIAVNLSNPRTHEVLRPLLAPGLPPVAQSVSFAVGDRTVQAWRDARSVKVGQTVVVDDGSCDRRGTTEPPADPARGAASQLVHRRAFNVDMLGESRTNWSITKTFLDGEVELRTPWSNVSEFVETTMINYGWSATALSLGSVGFALAPFVDTNGGALQPFAAGLLGAVVAGVAGFMVPLQREVQWRLPEFNPWQKRHFGAMVSSGYATSPTPSIGGLVGFDFTPEQTWLFSFSRERASVSLTDRPPTFESAFRAGIDGLFEFKAGFPIRVAMGTDFGSGLTSETGKGPHGLSWGLSAGAGTLKRFGPISVGAILRYRLVAGARDGGPEATLMLAWSRD